MDAVVDLTPEQIASMQDVTAECSFVKPGQRVRVLHNGRTIGILTCDGSYTLLVDMDSEGRSVLRVMHGTGR